VEVLLREREPIPVMTGRKSDRSADASGARSQTPFSLPKRSPSEDGLKKTLFVAKTKNWLATTRTKVGEVVRHENDLFD